MVTAPSEHPCLDVEAAVGLIERQLDPGQEVAIELHLDRCEPCRVLLADLAAMLALDDAGATVPAKPVPPRSAAPGGSRTTGPYHPPQRVEHYRIVRAIGSGGMGQVFLAHDTLLDRPVAIKFLVAHEPDEALLQRFLVEARAAARIQHPNVVAVHGVGSADGHPYLVSEYVEGETLAQVAKPLPPARAFQLALGLAAGLAAAHRRGVLHRDIKPSNAILTRDGSVKLFDFGLAKLIEPAARPSLSPGPLEDTLPGARSLAIETSPNMVVGTPRYMPPEAWEAAPATRSSDVWGLGAVLFELFSAETPFARIPVRALPQVTRTQPAPSLASVTTGLDPKLCGIVDRCLARDPALRFRSADAVLDALQAVATPAPRAGVGGEASRPTAAPADVATARSLGDEVRVVSVLYAEAIAVGAGLEAAVRAERGALSVFEGGRALAVFGGALWLGDEPERAVRAGLRARESGAAVLLGVGTGRCPRGATGQMTGAVARDARGVARDRGVGVDEETRRRVRGGFELQDDVVLAVRTGQSVVGVRGLGGADTPMFGRDAEMAHLLALFSRAVDDRASVGALVVGPAGIGKSRLVHELRCRALERASGITLLEARGEERRALDPWYALSTALRTLLELPEGVRAAEVHGKLRDVCQDRAHVEILGTILGVPSTAAPPRAMRPSSGGDLEGLAAEAIGQLLAGPLRQGPVLLVVEDAQWVGGPSLSVLELLLRVHEHAPLFVVATARPELEHDLPELRRLELRGLPRAATRAIVAAIVPEPGVADLIHDRCGGNPYFAEELALALGRDAEHLPPSVEAAVLSRLDLLPQAEKDVVRWASVFGRSFWVEALDALRGDHAAIALASLRRREIVVPEPRSRIEGTREWSFRHALTQEVAYRTVAADERARMHGAAARWLTAHAGAPAAEIALHLERSGASAEAGLLWITAAEVADRNRDPRAALECTSRAMAQDLPDRERLRAHILRTMAYTVLGQEAAAHRELALAEQWIHTPADRAAWLLRRGVALFGAGDLPLAMTELERAEQLDPTQLEASIYCAHVAGEAGRPREALDRAELAADKASRGVDRGLQALAERVLGHAHAYMGDLGLALAAYERALTAAEDAVEPGLAGLARIDIGATLVLLGRPELALGALEKEAQSARLRRSDRYVYYSLNYLGLALGRTGAVDEALRTLDESQALTRDAGFTFGRYPVIARAAILRENGRFAEAAEVIDGALESGDARGWRGSELQVRALRCAVLGEMGRSAEARTEAERTLVERRAAGGMEEFEAELFLGAHFAGIPGALAQGAEALRARAARISRPDLRQSFLERVPAHRQLLGLATVPPDASPACEA